MMRRAAAPFFSLLCVVPCSSTSQEPTYYLLRGDVNTVVREVHAELRAGVDRIVVAPYLTADPGIMVETAPGEIRPARLHQWAEPFDAGLRWFVQGEITRALGEDLGGGLIAERQWDYLIDVYVGRLHGTASGEALLEAAYVIRTTRKGLVEARFTKTLPLADGSYPALVEAEKALLSALAEAIAASLRGLIETTAGEASPG